MKRSYCFTLTLLLLPLTLIAAEPQPFSLDYQASYGSLSGSASRSLSQEANQWLLQSKVEVKLFGATITSIEELSRFGWRNEFPAAISYRFEQKGAGKRQRTLDFSSDGSHVSFRMNTEQGELSLTRPGFDALNSQLALRQLLLQGSKDLTISVADKGEVNAQHYQVVGTESVKTPAGAIEAVHLRRIREGDNKRQTDLWLAPAFDYAMVKFVQLEPDGDAITLEVKHGKVGTLAVGN